MNYLATTISVLERAETVCVIFHLYVCLEESWRKGTQ